jgi:metallo-beta-lactamase class B
MKVNLKKDSCCYVFFVIFNCSAQNESNFKTKEVYKSDNLIITQISENTFIHTSFKQTNDFGNVPCNGLVIRNNNEAIVFDTPTHDKDAEELIKWINEKLHSKIKAVFQHIFMMIAWVA